MEELKELEDTVKTEAKSAKEEIYKNLKIALTVVAILSFMLGIAVNYYTLKKISKRSQKRMMYLHRKKA